MTGNTPGIPKRSIPSLKPSITKASSVSSSAKSAATSGLNGAKKTQVFHRNLGQNGSVFGGGWQPAARGFNPHDPVSANVNRYAALRQQANMYNTGGMYNFGQVTGHNHSGTDKMAEVMAWTQLGMQALNMAGEMTTDIIELVQANKAAAPGATVAKAAIPTANTVSSANASLVSDMTAADDVASLRGAINNAENKYNEIAGSLSGLQREAEVAQGQLEQLTSEQQRLETKETELSKQVTAAEKSKSNAARVLENSKTALTAVAKDAATACENYAKAQGHTLAAKANLDSAKAALETLQGQLGTVPPEGKAALQAQITTAEAKVATANREHTIAQQAETQAKTARDAALKNENLAEEDVKQQEQNYARNQKDLELAEQKLEETKNELQTITQQKEKNERNIADANGVIAKYEAAQKDEAALKTALQEQRARLDQMEKDELVALTAENEKLRAGINAEDGMSTGEENKQKKIDKNQAQIDALYNGAIADILRQPADETIDGKEFRTGVGPDGETKIYMVGKEEVGASAYEAAKLNAQNTLKAYTQLSKQPATVIADNIEFRTGEGPEGPIYMIGNERVLQADYQAKLEAAQRQG